jgi:hypothetical protein
MGEGRASQLLGLTTMGYYDLEAYEDEWRTVVPLYITMFACRVFEIDILQFVPDQTGAAVGPNVLARGVIKERRETMGLSAEAFADRCGHAPAFTSIVEAGGLILYPFEVTRMVCEALDLDLKSFMQHGLLAPH